MTDLQGSYCLALRALGRVNPLQVACGIGKLLNLRLGDLRPIAHSQFQACASGQVIQRFKGFIGYVARYSTVTSGYRLFF